jgi:hypothetical protein
MSVELSANTVELDPQFKPLALTDNLRRLAALVMADPALGRSLAINLEEGLAQTGLVFSTAEVATIRAFLTSELVAVPVEGFGNMPYGEIYGMHFS